MKMALPNVRPEPQRPVVTGVERPQALAVRDLALGYNGHPALRDVSFAVEAGERVAIVGPNGAGKSTLFKGLVGLIPVRSGEIRIAGLSGRKALDRVAYVPQHEEIDWAFPVTALDVVLMGRYGRLGWLRRPGRSDHAVAHRLMEAMGIDHLAQRSIADLSGGEQQRVFLARALAQEPDILFLDEPFAGVDVTTQEGTLALLDRLHEEGVTVLVSTHDLALAAERFDRLLLLNGRLIAYGRPEEVLTADTMAEAFGAPKFFYQEGRPYLALTNECCPPERPFYYTGSHKRDN
jgi:ABC-type Mn2+/Zn2+ transport system ATPase subunit